MNASRAKSALGDLEAAPLTEQHVRRRYAHVLEHNLRMSVRRIVVAEHGEHPANGHAWRVHRHENHRLLLVPRRGGIRLAHEDRDLAARVAGA